MCWQLLDKFLISVCNKSSAAAKMGNCARAKWAEKYGGGSREAAVPLSTGELDPPNTMSPRLRPTSISSGILKNVGGG